MTNEEKGSAGISTIIAVLILLVAVTVSLVTFKLAAAQVNGHGLDSDVIGTPTESSRVVVTAEVLSTLGVKKVSADPEEAYYLVYGNNTKGFYVFDSISDSVVFNYDGFPGDGVLVPINRNINNIVFVGKY